MIDEKEEKEEQEAQNDMELEPKEPHEPFVISILSLIKTQRYQNGLRHNDHYRYRQYCTRRLRRLRIVLKYKFGKGKYKPNPFPKDFENSKFVELLIVQSERCWAHALQLKSDSAAAAQPNARWRLHLIKRMAKARLWSAQMAQVAEVHCDMRTQQEAKAYSAYIEATWHLEREEFAEALDALNTSKSHYERLGVACKDPKEQQVYKEMVVEMEPSFRLAKYHLGQIGEERETIKKRISVQGSDFVYRGSAVNVPNTDIKQKMINSRALLFQVDETMAAEDIAAHVELYGEASVAIADTLSDMHTQMIDAGDEFDWVKAEACMREFQCCLCLERNAVILRGIFDNRKAKPEEGMRFCDLIKADLTQLVDLADTRDDFKDSVTVYLNVVLNARAYFLAQCHFAAGKFLEAAALLDLTGRVDKDLVLDKLHEPLHRLQDFFTEMNRNTYLVATRLFTNTVVSLYKSASALENKSEKEEKTAMATFPPSPMEIEAKPLLLDLAFYELKRPNLDHLVKKKGVLGKVAGALTGWGGWRRQ